MEESGRESLGEFVQRMRKSRNMTQEKLGELAGYGQGAGVSISRFENDQLSPGPKKLAAIATALEITENELRERSPRTPKPARANKPGNQGDRDRRVDHKVAKRRQELTGANGAFRTAQEHVKSDYLVRLSEIGERLRGAQVLEVPIASDSDISPRRRGGEDNRNSGVSEGLVNGAALGTILSLLNVARALPIGGIAVPVIAGVAQGAVLGILGARREQAERIRKTQDAETELTATESNFSALMTLLPRATEILEYVAVHGGHAVERWERSAGGSAVHWDGLSDDARNQFDVFLEIAGATVRVYATDFESLAQEDDGEALASQTALIHDSLSRAEATVTAKV